MSIALAVLFLIGNAVFVGAQFALITARIDQVQPLARNGNRRAGIALGQMRRLDRMLAGSQLGIALCSLGLGAVAEPAFAHLLEDLFGGLSLSPGVLHAAAFVVALSFVAFCHMVLGEMVPKNLALAAPLPSALILGIAMAAWTRVTGIVLTIISATANGILRLFRVEPTSELQGSYTVDELAQLVDESAEEGLLDRDERHRLKQALALDVRTLAEVAIPGDRLETLPPEATVGMLRRAVADSGYSRFPVRSADRFVGYVHAKDLLRLDDSADDEPLPHRAVRPMAELDARLNLAVGLDAMKTTRAHMAVVADDGRQLGIVTLEDVLEQLLGEIPNA